MISSHHLWTISVLLLGCTLLLLSGDWRMPPPDKSAKVDRTRPTSGGAAQLIARPQSLPTSAPIGPPPTVQQQQQRRGRDVEPRTDPAFGEGVEEAIDEVRRDIPPGYASTACIPRLAHQKRFYLEGTSSSSSASASGAGGNTGSAHDRCVNIPRLKADVKSRMLQQIQAWKSEFHVKGLRILCWIGRMYSAEVVLRAVRMMLPDRGGAADVVVLQFRHKQKAALTPLITAMQFPPDRLSITISASKKRTWDFREQYNTVVDGYVHIKIDDDLFYLQPDFELFLFHRYLLQRHLAQQTDICVQSGNCSKQGREVNFGYRSQAAVCTVLGANVINHVGLTSLHAAMGALDVEKSSSSRDPKGHAGKSRRFFEWDFQNIRPIAHWAALHRALLRVIAAQRSPLEQFDFGLHHFDCDGQPRRWSINAVLFSFNSSVARQMPSDDEDFMTFQHGRLLRWMENPSLPTRTCSDGRAVTIHASFSGQFTLGWQYPKVNGEHALLRGLSTLSPFYIAIARHNDGSARCCESTGCVLFSPAMQDPGRQESIMCNDGPRCTFPFGAPEGFFASLENVTYIDGDTPIGGKAYALGIRSELTTWARLTERAGTVELLADDEGLTTDRFFDLAPLAVGAAAQAGAGTLSNMFRLRPVSNLQHCLGLSSQAAKVDVSDHRLHPQHQKVLQRLSEGRRLFSIGASPCPSPPASDAADGNPLVSWQIRPSPNGSPWYRIAVVSEMVGDAEGTRLVFLTALPSGPIVLAPEIKASEWPIRFQSHGGQITADAQDFRFIDRWRMG